MRRKMALCLLILLAASLCAGCAMPQQPVADGPTQQELEAIQKTAEEIVFPFADLYGMDDMEFLDVEVDSFDAVCTFASDDFAQLSPEDQLGFLADTLMSVYKEEPFPEESGVSGKGFGLEVVSGENRYRHFTSSGSHLLVNGNFTIEMDTLYSDAVSDSLEETMARVEAFLEKDADDQLLEIELRKNQPNTCPVCGTSFREGTVGARMVEEHGYCKSICRSRYEKLLEEAGG